MGLRELGVLLLASLVKLWASPAPVGAGRQQNLLGNCCRREPCIRSPVLASVLNAESKVLSNFQATRDALGKLGVSRVLQCGS